MWEGPTIKSNGKLSTNFLKVDFRNSAMRPHKVGKKLNLIANLLFKVRRIEVFKLNKYDFQIKTAAFFDS